MQFSEKNSKQEGLSVEGQPPAFQNERDGNFAVTLHFSALVHYVLG